MGQNKLYKNRGKILVGLILFFILSITVVIIQLTGVSPGETGFQDGTGVIRRDTTGLVRIDLDSFVGDEAEAEEKASGSYLYHKDRYMTEIRYTGIYDGTVFSNVYTENNRELMRVGSEFEPDDGVPSTYGAVKVVEGDDQDRIRAEIFVDNDFKEIAGQETNIAWGENWENFREFEFEEVEDNVYRDTVEADYVERMVHGAPEQDVNIAVGTFSQEEIEERKHTDIRAGLIIR